ncbi:hypothetical protein SAMN06295998_106132 [Primorskyibacter flagellatus]|uniref:Uncharacterized protein n=1 Tax=Primorskyibacter flagellatus TaxID=1387277 RepID=A0A1W2C7G1_9RHOB|nr:hypothetical protein SAMN06295998_106132 [Primorskyibacter flagellatus]
MNATGPLRPLVSNFDCCGAACANSHSLQVRGRTDCEPVVGGIDLRRRYYMARRSISPHLSYFVALRFRIVDNHVVVYWCLK